MNFFQTIPLTAALLNFGLTLFVLRRRLKPALTFAFSVWGLSITTWNIGVYLIFRSTNAVEAFHWARFLQVGVIFLPISLLHVCMLIAEVSLGKIQTFLYVVGVFFTGTIFTGHFVAGVRDTGYVYCSVAGPMFWAFLAVYSCCAVAIFSILYHKQKQSNGLHRARIRWLIAALGILVFFGTNDILLILGLDKYLRVRIYPLGSLAAIFYGVIVAYTVLQFQLLDIRVSLGRSVAQIVRFAFLFFLTVLLLFVSWLFVPSLYTSTGFLTATGIFCLSALMGSFFFPRLFGKGDEALERRILGDRFEYHDQVRRIIEMLKVQPDPRVFLVQLRELLADLMHLKSFQVILLDETTKGFSLFYSCPDRLLGPLADLDLDSPLLKFFRDTQSPHLVCNSRYAGSGDTELVQAARNQLKSFQPEFCFCLFAGEEIVGLLLLGPKENGDPYTAHDIQLFTEMVQNLSLLLNQVRLKNQVLMSQEQELLGRMSRGLAHDLNNLLTPVQTFLQLTAQDLIDEEGRNELLPIASRNIETVRAYVNEALFFSRTHALEVKPLRLDEAIRAAVELMQPRAQEKNVEINIQGLGTLVVEMDEIMIQRMLCNLISNAIDASPPGGPLKIHVLKLPRTETTRDWIRVKIIDAGEGISAENLQRIFTPYFTTKNRGDGKRGFGLGLAISRKIVHLHGGNLSVTSLEHKGTTVQIDLPSRHVQNPSRNPTLTDATYEATYKR